MSDRATVKGVALTFGQPGTQTILLGSNTSTTNPYPLPREDYTIQLSATTTGTSIGGGSVVWQVSNDQIGWIPQGTAALTSTNAGTSSNVAAAGFGVTTKYAYGRGVVISTGTGQETVLLGA